MLLANITVRPILEAALEVPRQTGCRAAFGICRYGVDIGMASVTQLERGQKCDGLSVRRPGWGAARQRTIRETAQRSRLTIMHRQLVNVASGQSPAIFTAA